MKQHRLALFTTLIATAIATPAFASSNPPTTTFDQDLANGAIAADTVKVKAKSEVKIADATCLGATNVIAKTTSGPPGWSAIAKTRDMIDGDTTKKLRGIDGASSADSATTGTMTVAAAPPIGFAREDLVAGANFLQTGLA